MADWVKGKVLSLSEKETAKGGTLYNVKLEVLEAEGEFEEDIDSEVWFGHGFDKPVFGKGDEIEFEVEWNGEYANFAVDTVEVTKEAPKRGRGSKSGGGSRGGSSRSSGGRSGGRGGSKSSGRGGSSRGSSGGGRGSKSSGGRAKSGEGSSDKMSKDDWAKKDAYIRWQSCHNTAIAFVRTGLECGAMSLPAKKGDKYDAYLALVHEEAEALFERYDELVLGKDERPRGGRRHEEEDDHDVPD